MNAAVNYLCLILLLLVGCSSSLQEPADVVGLWVASDGAQLELRGDGSFHARKLPKSLFPLSGIRTELVAEASGSWKLEPKDQKVRLLFDPFKEGDGGKSGNYVQAKGHGRNAVLMFWIDEPWGESLDLRRIE